MSDGWEVGQSSVREDKGAGCNPHPWRRGAASGFKSYLGDSNDRNW